MQKYELQKSFLNLLIVTSLPSNWQWRSIFCDVSLMRLEFQNENFATSSQLWQIKVRRPAVLCSFPSSVCTNVVGWILRELWKAFISMLLSFSLFHAQKCDIKVADTLKSKFKSRCLHFPSLEVSWWVLTYLVPKIENTSPACFLAFLPFCLLLSAVLSSFADSAVHTTTKPCVPSILRQISK